MNLLFPSRRRTDYSATSAMDANSSLNVLPETDFGPSASGRFDFTVLFENVVLSIVPSALFLILVPQRLLWLKREPRKIVENSRLLIKLVSAPRL